MITSTYEATTEPATGTRWLPLGVCSVGTFLLLLYGTVVTVSTPVIVADLDASYSQGQWQMDIYTLGLAALVLALGSAGDRVGHRRVFVSGAVLFAAATLACAVSWNGVVLVTARAAQGIGGAALFASTVPLLALTYDGRDRARAFAVWGTVAGAGSTVGTLAGGVVTQYASWRWLFLGTLPLCLAMILGARRCLPDDDPGDGVFDWVGTVGITGAAGAVTFAAINAGDNGWTSPSTLLTLTVGLLVAAVTVRLELRLPDPLLPLPELAKPPLIAAVLCSFAYYVACFSALPAIAAWLQHGLGMTAQRSALLLSVQICAFIIVTLTLATRLHSARADLVMIGGTLLAGFACLSGALLLLVPVTPGTPWAALLPMLLLTGVGAGLVTPVLPSVAVSAVLERHTGTAAAAANASRQFGLTLGIAVCGAFARQQAHDGVPSGGGVATGLALGVVVTALAGAASWWVWHRE